MLSANTGVAQFELSEYGRPMHGFGEPTFGDAGIFAPPQFASSDGAKEASHALAYTHAENFNQPPTFHNLGDGPGAWSHGNATSVSIYMQPALYALSSANALVRTSAPPATTHYFVVVQTNTLNQDDVPTSATTSQTPRIARATAPNSPSTVPTPKPAVDRFTNAPVFAPATTPANSLPFAVSTVFPVPIATQVSAQDSVRGSFESASAADTVFQAYSPRLLLIASNTNSAKSAAQSVADGGELRDESLDDFIELRDLASVQSENALRDVAAREQAAVDAILEGLQDLELLPEGFEQRIAREKTRDIVAVAALDTPLPLALAKIALANAEGGMVMLEFNDANSCDINFSNRAERNVELPAARLGVEAMVGFYQTVEIAGGEPAAKVPPVGKASPNPTKPTRPEARYSSDESSGSSRKSAAAIGISTLVSAMFWTAKHKRKVDKGAESESKKNRSLVVRG